jgi:hypothetical protein
MKIYFPRWFWPNNLGDSLAFSSIPNFIKKIRPNEFIEIITYGELIPLLQNSKHIDSVRLPTNDEIKSHNFYSNYCISDKNRLGEDFLVIYPENHPKLFMTISNRFTEFVAHDSLNFITLNFLLQIQEEDVAFKISDFYFFESKKQIREQKNSKVKIGIAPMTKTNGKSTPHPGCNGLGFRFNGINGFNSWSILIKELKKNLDIEIVEYSPSFLGLGDTHVGKKSSLFDLYEESCSLDYAITTDGGYHHLFNLNKTPLTLFTGTKVTKPEFMQLGNAYVPDVHLPCRKFCSSFYSEVFSTEDKSKSCNLECENLDPVNLAKKCLDDIQKRIYEK